MDYFELEKMRWSPRSSPSKGPRRLCKFCLLAIFMPVMLLCIPLYMRFLALRPHNLILSPSDMKLLNHESTVSTTWCKSQKLSMNSSFHAYLFNQRPKITSRKRRIKVEKWMEIQDDHKKYWGFYLLKGSSVRLGGCARYPGSSVVIVKGPKDAARCAWLGELDSHEESDEFSNERDEDYMEQAMAYTSEIIKDPTTEHMLIGTGNNGQDNENWYNSLTPQQKAYIFQMEKEKRLAKSKRNVFNDKNGTSFEEYLNSEDIDADKGGEDMTDYEYNSQDADIDRSPSTPDHLMNAGQFIQTNLANGKQDNSREEVRSSDSSSEERLRNCHGVIATYEFSGQKACGKDTVNESVLEWYPFNNKTNLNNTPGELMINNTGFYYFIFSNENEITTNQVMADIQLNKAFFNTNHSVEVCHNTTVCELYLDFWSNQHVLVEVPETGEENPECESQGFNNFDNFDKCNYIVRAESECQPRGEVYMIFLLLVPICILLFAYI